MSENVWASQVALVVKNLPANVGDERDSGSQGQEDALEEGTATPSVPLPGQSHAQRNLVAYRPWGCTESDMTDGAWHTRTQKPQSVCKFLSVSSQESAVSSVPICCMDRPGWAHCHLGIKYGRTMARPQCTHSIIV